MNLSQETDWLLIVEDQMEVWTLLRFHLKRGLPQVPLRHLADGPTALRYLQRCRADPQPLPGMILSDLYMPHLHDGLDFLTQLKDPTASLHQLPVLIVSSSTQVRDRQEVERRGGTFQTKPLSKDDWDEFIRTIQSYWHKRAVYIKDAAEGRQ
ncbi:response regulator [Spirosoma pulveris]